MSRRGRAPGTTLQRLAEAVLSRRVLDPVLLPALADLQHEHALVADASLARRARVLVRGYAGFWMALAQCLATWPPAVRLPTPGRGSMRQDLAYGLRVLGRQKAFSALAVLTLALGIGAATTIFSVIQNVLLDPFPVPRRRPRRSRSRSATRSSARPGGRTVFQVPRVPRLPGAGPSLRGGDRGRLRGRALRDRRGHRAVQRRRCCRPTTSASWACPRRSAARFAADDARPGAPPVFVMSHKMWAEHFGARPGRRRPELRAERRADDARRHHAAALHSSWPPTSTGRSRSTAPTRAQPSATSCSRRASSPASRWSRPRPRSTSSPSASPRSTRSTTRDSSRSRS